MPSMPAKDILVATKIDEALHKKLVARAKEQDRSIAYLIRQAIENLVNGGHK